MHTGPVSDHDGEFSEPEPTSRGCRKCKAETVTASRWDSSCGGYEDWKYECSSCGHYWWIEGPDA